MPNCFSSTFICLHRVPVFRGKLEGGKGDGERERNVQKKIACGWMKVERQAWLKVLFVSIIHIVILAKCHIYFFCLSPPLCRLPVLFPLRSVIQLHHLDVLLKSIMDSWGSPRFSSSFTEYSQCYSNLPTTPSCIGNETPAPAPTPPPWDRPPLHTARR